MLHIICSMLKWQLNTGTDHSIPHLYDVNTFQCYLSANVPEISVNGAINQVELISPLWLMEGLLVSHS